MDSIGSLYDRGPLAIGPPKCYPDWIFFAFSSKSSQIEPENACGAMKSQKAAI